MSENKTGKYLKYAIGEIILVVIGILIALQINNWNEQRKSKINEKALYSRILIDLQADEIRINNYINDNKLDKKTLKQIFQDSHGQLPQDSLINFSTLRASRIFDLRIKKNYSDYIKDIRNDSIKELIENYFKRETHISDAFELMRNFKEIELKPFLSKNGINNTQELFNRFDLDYYDLREENILDYSKLKKQYGTEELNQLLFDLAIRTSWSLSALDKVLEDNRNLQITLKKVKLSTFKI
ncbi:DUF6090 family protein [Winogradskyella sp. A2]|uniref:DUF6090 family protein n=1 Tax=Winogradskyella sp. A2 TaxID=3366944 RepID=UPI00398C7FC8